MKKAIFAAGCFWGVEEAFRHVAGIVSTRVGYTDGWLENPTYREVCSGKTGHAEAVEIEYDPGKISYEDLLAIFWEIHDPTTPNRQGPDVGEQYRSAVFFHDSEQRAAAVAFKEKLISSGGFEKPIVTEIRPAKTFFPAEEYHQQYLEKNGLSRCRG